MNQSTCDAWKKLYRERPHAEWRHQCMELAYTCLIERINARMVFEREELQMQVAAQAQRIRELNWGHEIPVPVHYATCPNCYKPLEDGQIFCDVCALMPY